MADFDDGNARRICRMAIGGNLHWIQLVHYGMVTVSQVGSLISTVFMMRQRAYARQTAQP